MPLSIRDLTTLPSPDRLRPLCEALAVLDLILFPEDWDDRRYSFDAAWGRGAMFQMRDGSGDHMNVLFPKEGGAAIRGFAHESAMSPWHSSRKNEGKPAPFPGLFEGLPDALSEICTEASFGEDEITFCAWWAPKEGWRAGNIAFRAGADPDGSRALLACLVGTPKTIAREVSEYVEEDIPPIAVKKLLAREPLTNALVRAITPEATLDDIREEALALGWKLSPPTPKKTATKKTATKTKKVALLTL